MTGKPRSFWARLWSQGGVVCLLHSSSIHYEKKHLKKHCPADTVVLAAISKGAQNPFVTLKFASSCVHDGHSCDKLFHSGTIRGPVWNARPCKTEESANHTQLMFWVVSLMLNFVFEEGLFKVSNLYTWHCAAQNFLVARRNIHKSCPSTEEEKKSHLHLVWKISSPFVLTKKLAY